MRELRPTRPLEGDTTHGDAGYTLIELLIVVLILGILASVIVLSVSGMRTDASGTTCDADRRIVGTAVETYFAHTESSSVPASGLGNDRYEQTLVDGGYLRAVSEHYDLDANGAATPQGGSEC